MLALLLSGRRRDTESYDVTNGRSNRIRGAYSRTPVWSAVPDEDRAHYEGKNLGVPDLARFPESTVDEAVLPNLIRARRADLPFRPEFRRRRWFTGRQYPRPNPELRPYRAEGG